MEDIANVNQNADDNLKNLHQMGNQKINSKEMNYSKYTLTSKSIEDSWIKDGEGKNEMNIFELISYKEKQLSLLLEAFENSYEKKSYRDLIKDIEEKEDLLYENSKMSYEIKIIKIKGLLKLLMVEYNNFLQLKNKNFHELDIIIQKIKNEFNIIIVLLIKNDPYIYEITTQTYCKFLYLLSKISIKKEDYLKSLGYVSLGINMLKIFFLKSKIASDINTYKIYCKLLLQTINFLIGDQNYEQALFYIKLLFKIIEVAIKVIYNNSIINKQKIPIATIKKFLSFTATGYMYTGCCLEQFDNLLEAFEAYKEAILFLKKSSRLGFSFQNLNSITISNSCSFLVEEAVTKLKLKFKKDKLDLLNMQQRLELQRKKEEYELLKREKLTKLRSIASGLGSDPFKIEMLENKLNKTIFSSSAMYHLKKIDDDLISLVNTYLDRNKNKNNNKSSNNNRISKKIKNNLSRYYIYNILMSDKYREFIKTNKKLEFYNPKNGSNSISLIQRHLNNRMQIKTNSNTSRKSLKLKNNFTESSKSRIKTEKNENFITTSPDSRSETERIKEKLLFLKRKKIKFRNSNNSNTKFLLTEDKSTTTDKKFNKKISLSLISKSTIKANNNNNKKLKFRPNKYRKELENDFEKNNLDKNIMTKSYIRKYSYYDKLADKELKFQKDMLYFKYNNTLYNKNKTIEEKNGIIGEDDIANISLILNERAKAKPIIDEKNLMEINLIKSSFGSKQNQFSVKMKTAMSSVISKYISERKSRFDKRNLVQPEKIRKLNEKKILILDNTIKDIDYNISQMKYLVTKTK